MKTNMENGDENEYENKYHWNSALNSIVTISSTGRIDRLVLNRT